LLVYIVKGRLRRPAWFEQMSDLKRIDAINQVYRLVKNLEEKISQDELECAQGNSKNITLSLHELNDLRDYLQNVTKCFFKQT
jgi:hypothetical protein